MRPPTRQLAARLGILLAASTLRVACVQAAQAECPDAPLAETTWNVQFGDMQAPGAPAGMGGGPASVKVTVEDCWQRLIAVFEEGRVVFSRFEPDESMALVWKAYVAWIRYGDAAGLSEQEAIPPELEQGYHALALGQLQKALFPKGDYPDVQAFSPRLYRATENSLMNDPRIFWFLSFHSPRHLRSVSGFAFVSERGALPSPPHTQSQDWNLATDDVSP